MQKRLVESFWLYSKTGRKYHANVYQEFHDISTAQGHGTMPGLKEIRLDDGNPLNPGADENSFENVITKEVLFRKVP